MTQTLRFLIAVEAIGLAGLPLAARAFGRLPGAGLGLAKVLGLLLLGWIVWLAGSLGVPNGLGLAVGGAVVLTGLAVVAAGAGRGAEPDPFRRRALIASEAVFLVSFGAGVLLFAFSPDVWGTEKPMDMMLVSATLVTGSFPPHDPWLSGEQLNYYYLGQLMAGLLIRFTGVEPTQGYNLAMGTLLALTATAAFTVGAAVAEAGRRQGLPVRRPLLAGLGAVVLLAIMGNLRGGWDALHVEGPLTGFDWFSASRVIADTINEFPYFSFLVGDLHAHLIAVPLTLLALAFVFQAAVHGPPRLLRFGGWWETFCAALAIGILYAVNSWSWPVTVGLFVMAVVVWVTSPDAVRRRKRAVAWAGGVVALGIVVVLPFILNFDPNARGLALVDTAQREPLGAFLRHHLVMEGALLWLLVAPLLGFVRGASHPFRVLVWSLAVAAVSLPLLAGSRLAGAALVALVAVAALAGALRRRSTTTERALWVVAATALACIAAPELVIVQDEFAGTEFERMNTVFKMGYQAWILLAVAGAVALGAAGAWLPRVPRWTWRLVAAGLVGISLAYTVAGADARNAGFADGPRLDGRRWLARTAPGDIAAIDWLRANSGGEDVVLEAVGDDYSPFGNARVSTYTGRPTLLGWQGHELQWSHDVGTRRTDVEALYRTTDFARAKALLEAYRVSYAVVGPLERTFYGNPGALVALGRKVFDRRGTAVYAYAPPPEPEAPDPDRGPVLGR